MNENLEKNESVGATSSRPQKKKNNIVESTSRRSQNLKEARQEFGVEVGEDSTKYGEFVSSYFAWISLPEQKERAEELNSATKKKK